VGGGVRVPRVGTRGKAVGGKGAWGDCGGGKWEGDEGSGSVIRKVNWRGWGASEVEGAFGASSEGLSAGDSPAVGFAGVEARETEMGASVGKDGVAGVEFCGAVRSWTRGVGSIP
jgi:hypothetical protein